MKLTRILMVSISLCLSGITLSATTASAEQLDPSAWLNGTFPTSVRGQAHYTLGTGVIRARMDYDTSMVDTWTFGPWVARGYVSSTAYKTVYSYAHASYELT